MALDEKALQAELEMRLEIREREAALASPEALCKDRPKRKPQPDPVLPTPPRYLFCLNCPSKSL